MAPREAPAPVPAKGRAIAPARASGPYFGMQALGLIVVALGAVLLAAGAPGAGVAGMTFGAVVAAFGMSGLLLGPAAQAVHTSLNLIALGRLAEAEKILDAAEKRTLGHHRGALLQQRAIIALRRGDLPTALAHVDAAVRLPLGFYRGTAALQRTNALGIRALVRASLGDAEGALADAAAVRAQPDAFLQAQARAALAEAMLLERSGDRTALRELLQRRGEVLLEGTGPRERAIVRAYQRMVKVTVTTPYRQSARREEPAPVEEPALAEWVAKIAPGAAAFVRVPAVAGGGELVPAAATTDEARRAVADARLKPAARALWVRAGRILLVLALLTGAVYAALSALESSPAPGDAPPVDVVFDVLTLALISIVVAGFAVLGTMFADGRRQSRRLVHAAAGLVTRPAQAEADLAALTKSRYAILRAQAHHLLALLAERRGDAAGILDHCARGLADVSARGTRAMAGDLVTPLLSAERAVGLAVHDRFDEAHAEIESLPASFPLLALARFRVRLLSLVRQGDLPSALRFVERETLDLPLAPRDELLADAVRVAVAPHTCGAAEVLRVKEDLRAPGLRRYVEAFAPGLLLAVERASEDDDLLAREEAEVAREEAAVAELARA